MTVVCDLPGGLHGALGRDCFGGFQGEGELLEGEGKVGDGSSDGLDLDFSGCHFGTDGVENEGKAKAGTGNANDSRYDAGRGQ